jgi:hypothetical protein
MPPKPVIARRVASQPDSNELSGEPDSRQTTGLTGRLGRAARPDCEASLSLRVTSGSCFRSVPLPLRANADVLKPNPRGRGVAQERVEADEAACLCVDRRVDHDGIIDEYRDLA